MIGSFVVNPDSKLYLQTKPGQTSGFRCLNEQLFNDSIEDTIKISVKEKTGLNVKNYKLINVTEGFDVPKDGEKHHMVFVDYVVYVDTMEGLKTDTTRISEWLTCDEWLKKDESDFAPYIKNVVKDLSKSI